MDDQFYMRVAIKKARAGVKNGQTPFGACIVRAGEIIASEHNVVWRESDITAHAEIHAIRQACQQLRTVDLSGATIYSSVEPCPMCFSAIHWAGISRIVYGARIEDAQEAGFKELPITNEKMKREGHSKIEITKDVLRDESQAVFSEWLNRSDRRPY